MIYWKPCPIILLVVLQHWFGNTLGGCKLPGVGFMFDRNYDLQQYFRTLRHTIRHFPPTSRLCQFSETTHQDYSFLDFLFRDVTSRFDASAECLIWEHFGLHLPTWQILLRPARIEGLHD